jgi:antitoxin CptB
MSDTVDAIIDERALSRLKWSCRRGLLENDLFIQRFFQTHESHLSLRQARGLQHLMDLSDNDLLDLLLRRSELPAALDRPEVREVLSQLRRPLPVSTLEGMTP